MEDVVLSRMEGSVLVLTLNKPSNLNPIGQEMIGALAQKLRAASTDAAVRVVVLGGAGRGFCSGGDIKGYDPNPEVPLRMKAKYGSALQWDDADPKVAQLRHYSESAYLLRRMEKPTIALVRGPAAGTGFSMALACDFIISSETAVFTSAFTRLSVSGAGGMSYLLSRRVGLTRATELLMLSDRIDAKSAHAMGITHRVVPDQELETQGMALAHRLAKGPPIAYAYIKENLDAAQTSTFEEMLRREARSMAQSGASEDSKEGARAFLEKRSPVFHGR